jgi:SAM-dependent methyltransferase
VSPPDYKSAWDAAARADAQDAVLTLSSRDYFEWTGERDAQRVRKYAGSEATVLSIGCGIGRVESFLAPHVKELWAIDVSAAMIEQARQRLAPFSNVHFREVGNADFLDSFEPATFDVVCSFLMLQHLEKEDAARYMRDAHRVLRRDGVFLAQFPNYLAPEYSKVLLDDVGPSERSPARVRAYTENEVRHSLRLLNFEISDLSLEWGKEGNAEIYVAARTK